MNKKAEIEIQFNWVFVLIAGALIFLFFFSVIKWIHSNSEQSSSIAISNYLSSIYTSASVMEQTYTPVNIPFKKIEFFCEGFLVDKNDKQSLFQNKIVFAPSRLEGGQLGTWSLSWRVPFRVTNFLYLSSPKMRYVIIGQDGEPIYDYLKDKFPGELNPEFFAPNDPSLANIENYNHFKVRFVYVNAPFSDRPSYLSEFRKMNADDVTALVINAASFDESGELTFYTKSSPATSDIKFVMPSVSSFLGEAALMAAIFSDSRDYYECNMKKAFKKMALIANVYMARTGELKTIYGSGAYPEYTHCQSLYAAPITKLGSIVSLGNTQNLDFNSLSTYYSDIKAANDEVQRNSCALIY